MFKGRQFGQSVILLCVRWCLAYNLSLGVAQPKPAGLGIVPVQ
jgi:transposase-like protein